MIWTTADVSLTATGMCFRETAFACLDLPWHGSVCQRILWTQGPHETSLLDLHHDILKIIVGRLGGLGATALRCTCKELRQLCPDSVSCAPRHHRELSAAVRLCADARQLCLDFSTHNMTLRTRCELLASVDVITAQAPLCIHLRRLQVTGLPRRNPWDSPPAVGVLNGLLSFPNLHVAHLVDFSSWDDIKVKFSRSLRHLLLDKVSGAISAQEICRMVSQELPCLETLYLGGCSSREQPAGRLLMGGHKHLRALHLGELQPEALDLPPGCAFSARWTWQVVCPDWLQGCSRVRMLQLNMVMQTDGLRLASPMPAQLCDIPQGVVFAGLTHLRIETRVFGQVGKPVTFGDCMPSLQLLKIVADAAHVHVGSAMPTNICLRATSAISLQSVDGHALAAHIIAFYVFRKRSDSILDFICPVPLLLKCVCTRFDGKGCSYEVLHMPHVDWSAALASRACCCHCGACPACLHKLGVIRS